MENFSSNIEIKTPEDVQKALSLGQDLNALDSYGYAPLHNAARLRNIELVQALIDAKADVNIKCDRFKMTPLHIAAYRSLPILKLLIQAGADVSAQDHEGLTPLHYVAESHDGVESGDTVAVLRSACADINVRDSYGETPLFHAVHSGNIELVSALIDCGANLDIASNDSTETPLICAIRKNYTDIALLLIRNGANVNLCDERHVSPLHFAVSSGDVKVVDELLKAKADPNALTRYGQTPFFFISSDSDSIAQILKKLFDAGADVNTRDNDLSSPLHVAAMRSNEKAVRALLSFGADPTVRDVIKRTPYELAKTTGIARLLTDVTFSLPMLPGVKLKGLFYNYRPKIEAVFFQSLNGDKFVFQLEDLVFPKGYDVDMLLDSKQFILSFAEGGMIHVRKAPVRKNA